MSADDVASLYGDKAPRRRERTAVAAEEADAMYDATVAATAARREGRGGAAYGEREQRRGPAAAAVGGRGRLGRRAAVHLEDEEGGCRMWAAANQLPRAVHSGWSVWAGGVVCCWRRACVLLCRG